MLNKIKKYRNYGYLILLSIIVKGYYQNETFYFGVKYLTSTRVIDMMFSILFSFLIFKIYLDHYYDIILNRTNIIIRTGKKKYEWIILKKLITHTFFLILLNILIDYILIRKIKMIFVLPNIMISELLVVILSKRKEYNNELVIIIIISLILRYIFSCYG